MLKVTLAGDVVDRGNTDYTFNLAGFVIHSAVHAHRPDLRCVIHSHHHAVVTVASTRHGLLPCSLEACKIWPLVSRVTHPFEGIQGCGKKGPHPSTNKGKLEMRGPPRPNKDMPKPCTYGLWIKLSNTMVRFLMCVCYFSKMCFPRKAGKIILRNCINPKMFGFDRIYDGFTSCHMQIRCKHRHRCI